ncbi:MAG: hypothetical protein WCI72_06330 [archaeon]
MKLESVELTVNVESTEDLILCKKALDELDLTFEAHYPTDPTQRASMGRGELNVKYFANGVVYYTEKTGIPGGVLLMRLSGMTETTPGIKMRGLEKLRDKYQTTFNSINSTIEIVNREDKVRYAISVKREEKTE